MCLLLEFLRLELKNTQKNSFFDICIDTSDTSTFFLLVSRFYACPLYTDTPTLMTLVFFQVYAFQKIVRRVCVWDEPKFTSVTSVVVSITDFVPKMAVFLTLVVFFTSVKMVLK